MVDNDPTTVNLDIGQRAALDVIAKRDGETRSVVIRRFLAQGLMADALREHENASQSIVDPHVVNVVIPVVDDAASPEVKSAVAARNAATLAGRCPHCEAEPHIVHGGDVRDELVRVHAGAARPASTRSARPSVSQPPPPDQRPAPRTSVTVKFDHRPECPARGDTP